MGGNPPPVQELTADEKSFLFTLRTVDHENANDPLQPSALNHYLELIIGLERSYRGYHRTQKREAGDGTDSGGKDIHKTDEKKSED